MTTRDPRPPIETYKIGYLPWHRIAGRWRVWRAGYGLRGLRPDLGASLKRWPRDRWLRPWQAEWDGCRHELVDRLGRCYSDWCHLMGHEASREGDGAEFASRIHDLQARVLARAAARAYPERYRLMGGGVLGVPPS